MLVGTSYYHEYQPFERLAKDIEMMVQANLTVIRVGESTWASYEPEDGKISFAALRRVVDAAHAAGIKVIVGTPTYAVPAWLYQAYPEVMARRRDGKSMPYGARQNVDFTHPAYLHFAERLVRAMGREFGGHPGVIAFQVDNEIGAGEIANDHVLRRFRKEVSRELGGVEGINAMWGLTYWSHRLAHLDELWSPEGNTNPGYELQWDRFQAILAREFLEWQRDILREYTSPDQVVFHDVSGGPGGPATDVRAIGRALDKGATNIYVTMQKAIELPEPDAASLVGLAPPWTEASGIWEAVWKADFAYSQHGEAGSNFYVTEAQASSVGGPATNVAPYPGQLRLMAHLFLARGADLLAYWHWHTLHYGLEMYWGGILGHDLEPNRIYKEVSVVGEEMKRLSPRLASLRPGADLAFLYSRDSMKALNCMPPLVKPGTAEVDAQSYLRIFTRFYQACLDARLQVRIVHEDSDWSGQAVLVVPALYVADNELLDRVAAHAQRGAHVVVTFRSGYADQWARARVERPPGRLREAAGCSYQEYSNLVGHVQLRAGKDQSSQPGLVRDAYAEAWADLLEVEGATGLWFYGDPFLRDYPAVTTHVFGLGRITWVGTLPDRASAASLMSWAVAERKTQPAAANWGVLPPQVRVNSAGRPDGTTLWFVANHSWDVVPVAVPFRALDLTDDTEVGAHLTLGPWDSRILEVVA